MPAASSGWCARASPRRASAASARSWAASSSRARGTPTRAACRTASAVSTPPRWPAPTCRACRSCSPPTPARGCCRARPSSTAACRSARSPPCSWRRTARRCWPRRSSRRPTTRSSRPRRGSGTPRASASPSVPQGATLDVSSLAALVSGGVELDNLVSGGEQVEPGTTFQLFSGRAAALSSVFTDPDAGASVNVGFVFSGDVSGLSAGSPVELRGLRIGQVAGVTGVIDEERFGDRRVRLLATAELEPSRVVIRDAGADTAASPTPEEALDSLAALADEGVRAHLARGSILVGGLKIVLDEEPNAAPAAFDRDAQPFPIFPTTAAEIPEAADTVEGLIARVNDLPIEELLSGTTTLIGNVNAVIGSDAVRAIPDEALGLVADMRALVGSEAIQQAPGRDRHAADRARRCRHRRARHPRRVPRRRGRHRADRGAGRGGAGDRHHRPGADRRRARGGRAAGAGRAARVRRHRRRRARLDRGWPATRGSRRLRRRDRRGGACARRQRRGPPDAGRGQRRPDRGGGDAARGAGRRARRPHLDGGDFCRRGGRPARRGDRRAAGAGRTDRGHRGDHRGAAARLDRLCRRSDARLGA